MGPIFGKKSTMSTVTALTRSAAKALIERESHRVGSRMVAYEIVAQTVGTSADWLRKFIGPCGEAKRPDVEVGFNILSVYERLVTGIDANTKKIEEENQALRKQIHAASPIAISERLEAGSEHDAAAKAVVDEGEG